MEVIDLCSQSDEEDGANEGDFVIIASSCEEEQSQELKVVEKREEKSNDVVIVPKSSSKSSFKNDSEKPAAASGGGTLDLLDELAALTPVMPAPASSKLPVKAKMKKMTRENSSNSSSVSCGAPSKVPSKSTAPSASSTSQSDSVKEYQNQEKDMLKRQKALDKEKAAAEKNLLRNEKREEKAVRAEQRKVVSDLYQRGIKAQTGKYALQEVAMVMDRNINRFSQSGKLLKNIRDAVKSTGVKVFESDDTNASNNSSSNSGTSSYDDGNAKTSLQGLIRWTFRPVAQGGACDILGYLDENDDNVNNRRRCDVHVPRILPFVVMIYPLSRLISLALKDPLRSTFEALSIEVRAIKQRLFEAQAQQGDSAGAVESRLVFIMDSDSKRAVEVYMRLSKAAKKGTSKSGDRAAMSQEEDDKIQIKFALECAVAHLLINHNVECLFFDNEDAIALYLSKAGRMLGEKIYEKPMTDMDCYTKQSGSSKEKKSKALERSLSQSTNNDNDCMSMGGGDSMTESQEDLRLDQLDYGTNSSKNKNSSTSASTETGNSLKADWVNMLTVVDGMSEKMATTLVTQPSGMAANMASLFDTFTRPSVQTSSSSSSTSQPNLHALSREFGDKINRKVISQKLFSILTSTAKRALPESEKALQHSIMHKLIRTNSTVSTANGKQSREENTPSIEDFFQRR